MHYQEMVNELAAPWKYILKHTNLLVSKDGTALLVVQESNKDFFTSFEILSIVFPMAKKLYPKTTSLALAWGPEFEYVKNGVLEIVDVKIRARNEFS